MRATEHERVDRRGAHRREEPLGQHVDLIGVDVAGLDELDEARARGARELDAGASPAARWYAPDAIVPTVPITPTRPVRVAAAAARTPGSTTPITGIS